VHTALTVAREEGAMALWNGATATTIRQGSNQMSLFWGKAVCDRMIWDKHVSCYGNKVFRVFVMICIATVVALIIRFLSCCDQRSLRHDK
jgi:hypothetical protein